MSIGLLSLSRPRTAVRLVPICADWMETMFSGNLTGVSNALSFLSPHPSWPLSFHPQVASTGLLFLSRPETIVCQFICKVSMETISVGNFIRVNVVLSFMSPQPNLPK